MSAPTFYGIDPDVLYPWSPDEAKGQDGAPVIDLAPLSERMSLRVGALRQKQASLYLQARKRTLERLITEAEGKEEKDAEDIKSAIFSEEVDALEEKASAIYSEEVQSAVLSECVKGWRNFVGPKGAIEFKGEPARDLRCLPAKWKAEIFYAIVTESAWKVEDEESFTSQPE